MAQTRSGITAAAIINLSTSERVNCMFNPSEYSLNKSNTWERKDKKGTNVPSVEFKQGGSQTLKLQLMFDTLADGTDVREYTDMLWKMMAVDDSLKDSNTNKGRPPAVAFEWGTFYFKAVITSMSQKITLFSETGIPLRTTVDVTLEQFVDEADYKPQPVGATPATSADATQVNSSTNLAAQPDYRETANANNIDNPQTVPNGTVITQR